MKWVFYRLERQQQRLLLYFDRITIRRLGPFFSFFDSFAFFFFQTRLSPLVQLLWRVLPLLLLMGLLSGLALMPLKVALNVFISTAGGIQFFNTAYSARSRFSDAVKMQVVVSCRNGSGCMPQRLQKFNLDLFSIFRRRLFC